MKPWERYSAGSAAASSQSGAAPWEAYAPPEEEEEERIEAAPEPEPGSTLVLPEDQQIKENPEPDTLDKARHVAGGVAQAGFDLLDMPANIADMWLAGSDYLYGEEGLIKGMDTARKIDPTYHVAQFLKDKKPSEMQGGRQAKELLAKETVTREEAPLTDAMRTGLEWGAGGLYRAGQKLAGKAASMLPDVIMGGAAGAGQLVGGDTGELAGGLVGLLLALRTGDFSKLTKAEQNALEAIAKNSDDPARAMKNLEQGIASGEIGSLADLTKDPTMFDIELALGASDARVARKLDDIAVLRENQTASRVESAVGGGQVDEALEVAGERVSGRVERIQDAAAVRGQAVEETAEAATERSSAIQQAVEDVARMKGDRAAQAAKEAGSRARSAEVSTEFTENLQARDKALRAEMETPAWNAFKEGPSVKPAPVKSEVNAYLDGLVKEERELLQRTYGRHLRQIDEWDDAGVPPQSVQAVLSQMKDSLNRAESFGSAEKFLNDITGAVDDALEDSNKLFAAAKQATRDRVKQTGGKQVGKTVRKAEAEEVIRKLGLSNEKGAVMLRRLEDMNDPQAKSLIAEQMRVLANREGIDQKFMEKYADILDGFPEMRQQMRGVVRQNDEALAAASDAKTAVKEQEKYRKTVESQRKAAQTDLQKRADKLSKNTEKGLVGSFARAPKKTVKDLLASPDRIPQLTRLYQSMRRLGGGDGFKGAVREGIMDRLTKVTPDGRTVNPGAFGDFEKMREGLVASGLLTGRQADEIATNLARQSGSTASRKSAIRAGIENPSSELQRLLSSGAAAATMQFTPGGQSLILAGAVRRAFMHLMKRKIGDKELRGMEDFILNPQKYLAAAKDAENINNAVDRIMTSVVAGGQVLAGEGETEQ